MHEHYSAVTNPSLARYYIMGIIYSHRKVRFITMAMNVR